MCESRVIRVGTRKSKLALAQTHTIVSKLEAAYPDVVFETVTMETIGDKILDVALSKIGEKSLFTKELEVALEAGAIDMIVHSLKDLPTTLPANMCIGLINKRDSPYDCVLLHPKHRGAISSIAAMPDGSVIGTSSLRRIAQLKRNHPKLVFKDIRGNIHTRISKLEEKDDYDAIILAEAGLQRMGMGERVDEVLRDDVMLYAVSQGAIAVECKSDDSYVRELLHPLNDPKTLLVCNAERAFMRFLEGGCSVPLGVSATVDSDETITLKGVVVSLDGADAVSAEKQAKALSVEDAQELGASLGETMLALGAKNILDALRSN